MALLDISEVTTAFTTLIGNALTGTPYQTVAVLPEPPNQLSQNGLAFYLYHAQENPAFKNLPAPGADRPPVAYTSLGLNLYYQMTAHYYRPNLTGALDEQNMMGLAMKALHENPVLDIGVGPDGSTNHIRISLQPIPYHEAAHYWTAGTQPIKFAAYYEVTVVLLQPKRTTSMAGRVLSYGNFVFPDGIPRISGTSNTVKFTAPGALQSQELTIQPAQVAPGGDMLIDGSSWNGDSVGLQFYSDNWPGALTADATWMITSSALDQLQVTIPQTVMVNGSSVNVLPGSYRVQVVVQRTILDSTGQTRVMTTVSNQFPFMVTPRIDGVLFAATTATISGWYFALQPAPPSLPTVDAFLGATHLDTVANAPLPPNYDIQVLNQLIINLPPATPSGTSFPLRIMVNGAESAPYWLVAP
jgi:hypothetical protein